MTPKNPKTHKINPLEELKQQNKELTETLQRLQAEFENYQKRTQKQILEFTKFSNEALILKFLEIIDNFDLALKHSKDDGIKLIHSQFISILEKEGLQEIKAKEFDPNFHEAIAKINSEEKENTIIEIHQKGYLLNDKVIRHSKVIISGGNKNE